MKNIFILFVLLLNLNLLGKEISLTQDEKVFLQNNKTFKIGHATNFAPLYMESDEGKVEGIIPDLYNLVASKLNISFSYTTNSWENTLKNVQSGKLDIVPMVAPKIATKYDLLKTDAIYSQLFGVFGKKGSEVTLTSLKDLKGLRIAYTDKILILDQFLQKYKDKNTLIGVDTPFQAFNQVISGQADVAIIFNISGRHLIKKHYLLDIEPLHILEEIKSRTIAGVNSENIMLHSILKKALNSISYEEKKEIINRWSDIPNENSLLTKEEQKYLENKVFNAYYVKAGWHPFLFKKGNVVQGISADIWNEIVQNSDIKSTYVEAETFSKILDLFKDDSLGVLPSTSATKKREEYATFTKPYASFPVAILTKINENFIINLKELEGKKIAVGENYSAHKLLKKHYPNIDFVTTNNTQEAMDLVANGEVFGAADILPVVNYQLNVLGYNNLKISGTSEFEFKVQISVNKTNSQLIPILNKLIDNISEERKRDIINKWIYTANTIERIDYTVAYWIGSLSLLILLFGFYRQSILRKQKQEVEKINKKFRSLFDYSLDSIVLLDMDTQKFTDVNPKACQTYGYSKEEFFNLEIKDI